MSIETSGYEISWTVEAQTIPAAAQRSRTAERQTASRKLAAVDAQVTTGLELTEQNRVEVTPTELDNLTDQKAAIQADLDESGDTWSPEVNEAVRALNEDIQAVNQHIISAVSFATAMVEYPQALGEHTTLRYTMSPGKIKEEVVIDTPDALDTYCVRMNTNGLTAVPDANKGIHLQNDEGEDVVYIAPPLLYDAADEISRNVAVSMTQEGDECVLTYTPDKEWLNDEARVWPVVIDPTVSSVTIAQQNQIDNYVYEGQTAPLNDSSSDLYVGCYSRGGTLRDHRAYWQLASLPTLPSGTSPTNASFHIRLKNGTSSMGAIELYKAGSGWNSYMLKWSNMPDPSTYLGERASVPSGSEKWLVYDSGAVTNVVKDWYNYPSSNHGFILKYRTCVNDYNTFYSSDYRPGGSTAFIPYLSVSYVDTIPVSQVCLSPSSKMMSVGDTFRLTASVLPSNATNKGIIYSTDDYSIADVDPLTGIVTAVGLGTTTIYATSASNGSKYDSCTIKVIDPDPFHPSNIEYLRIKKYDQSSMGGDSDITTVVTKSFLESAEYFECYAPNRAEVAFKIDSSMKNYLHQQEASFQDYPTMYLPNFYFHLAKLGVDDMAERDIIQNGTAEYYGIWASESYLKQIKLPIKFN